MKRVLGSLIIVAMAAAWSSATSNVYEPTKDNFWRFDVNGGNENYGSANAQRAGKGWQDGFYMDFDRAAILADAAAVLGHPVTAADFANGNITATLSLMAAAGSGFTHTAAYQVGYFTSTTPWTEAGATYNKADGTNAWNGGGANGNLRDCPLTLGATQTVWAAADDTYQIFPVDANIASGFLLSTAPGVAIEANGVDWGNNGSCYSKEGAGHPQLTVTVTPEPATMALLALGGFLFVRRRQA